VNANTKIEELEKRIERIESALAVLVTSSDLSSDLCNRLFDALSDIK